MTEYNIYWGESHDNTYQFAQVPVPIEEVAKRARSHLDFYAAAYYTATAEAFQPGGHLSETDAPAKLALEGWKDDERLEREWAEVQEAMRAANEEGAFVTFPGYEWQGDGSSGDHNVYFRTEGAPVFKVNTVRDLYAALHAYGGEALAIPHHVGYRPGRRGRNWDVYDETLSPFAEIYSIHGCSETDEEWIGLRNNSHMGPGQGGGTYQDALDRGYHLGAVCSTDNWGEMPGHYGNGRMACLAPELSREEIWRSFKERRVYGVTGDRIEIDFRVNGAPMGSRIAAAGPRHITVSVRGSDAVDRIELLRNGRVIATHVHQGTWTLPPNGVESAFKIRVEAGWGPRANELTVPPHAWTGALRIENGTVVGVEPCWVSPGQTQPRAAESEAHFGFTSTAETLKERSQNADVFEVRGRPNSRIRLDLNGLSEEATLADLAARSRIMWYKDECVKMLEERAGIPPGDPERDDIYWHVAHKAKIHRAVPEDAYTATLEVDDDEPCEGEIHYRVRVEQRNGQRAWTSPVWVREE